MAQETSGRWKQRV